MDDDDQPEEIMNALRDEILADPELGALVLDRWLEGMEFDRLETALNLSWYQDPSTFPPKRQPGAVEAIRAFLEKKYGKTLQYLAATLTFRVFNAISKERGL